jgi:hypothetical protein
MQVYSRLHVLHPQSEAVAVNYSPRESLTLERARAISDACATHSRLHDRLPEPEVTVLSWEQTVALLAAAAPVTPKD